MQMQPDAAASQLKLLEIHTASANYNIIEQKYTLI